MKEIMMANTGGNEWNILIFIIPVLRNR
jgi:hypothetical protein